MPGITSGLARAARNVAALERELGRAAMLTRAIDSDDLRIQARRSVHGGVGNDAGDHGRGGAGASGGAGLARRAAQ